MTEGTSQGLFIVVAIVIFGIFIGLSYTLFGSEGLTNDIKGIFENGIAKADESLNPKKLNFTDLNIKASDLTVFTEYHNKLKIIDENSFSVTRTGKNKFLAMYFLNNDVLISGNTYKISAYIDVDGVAVTKESFTTKKLNTEEGVISFNINENTGYVEVIQKWGTSSAWFQKFILHTGITNKDGGFNEGEVITVRDLKLQKLIED